MKIEAESARLDDTQAKDACVMRRTTVSMRQKRTVLLHVFSHVWSEEDTPHLINGLS